MTATKASQPSSPADDSAQEPESTEPPDAPQTGGHGCSGRVRKKRRRYDPARTPEGQQAIRFAVSKGASRRVAEQVVRARGAQALRDEMACVLAELAKKKALAGPQAHLDVRAPKPTASARPRERCDSSAKASRAGPSKPSDDPPGEFEGDDRPHHLRHSLARAGYPRPAIDTLDPLETRRRAQEARKAAAEAGEARTSTLDLERIDSKLTIPSAMWAGRRSA